MASLEVKYAKLNNRFDDRAAQLRALGFKYTHQNVKAEGAVRDVTIGVFVLRDVILRTHAIQASAVMYADDCFWDSIYEDAVKSVRGW